MTRIRGKMPVTGRIARIRWRAGGLLAEDPAAFGPLLWGERVSGVRVRLATIPTPRLCGLIEDAWRRKAPARLVAGTSGARER